MISSGRAAVLGAGAARHLARVAVVGGGVRAHVSLLPVPVTLARVAPRAHHAE